MSRSAARSSGGLLPGAAHSRVYGSREDGGPGRMGEGDRLADVRRAVGADLRIRVDEVAVGAHRGAYADPEVLVLEHPSGLDGIEVGRILQGGSPTSRSPFRECAERGGRVRPHRAARSRSRYWRQSLACSSRLSLLCINDRTRYCAGWASGPSRSVVRNSSCPASASFARTVISHHVLLGRGRLSRGPRHRRG